MPKNFADALSSELIAQHKAEMEPLGVQSQLFPDINEGNVAEQLRTNTALQETLRDYYRKYEDREFDSVGDMIDHLYTTEAFQRHNDVGIAFKLGESALADDDKKQYLSLVSRIYSALPTDPTADGGSWKALGAMVAGELTSVSNFLGAGIAGKTVAKTAASEAIEAGIKAGAREGFESAAIRKGVWSGMKSGAAADFAINTGSGAALSMMEQGTEVELGLRDETSLTEAALQGAAGAGLGAVLGGGVGMVAGYRGAKEALGEVPEMLAKHDANVAAEAAAKAEAEAAANAAPAPEPQPATIQTVDADTSTRFDFIRNTLSDLGVAVREDSTLASHLGRLANEHTISDLMARVDAAKNFPSENASLGELMAKAERDAAELAAAGDHNASLDALRTREQYQARIDANNNFTRALDEVHGMLTSAGPDDEVAILSRLLGAAEKVDASKGIDTKAAAAEKVKPEEVATKAATQEVAPTPPAPKAEIVPTPEAKAAPAPKAEEAPTAEVKQEEAPATEAKPEEAPAEDDPLGQLSAIEEQLAAFTNERDALISSGDASPETINRIAALEGTINQAKQSVSAIRKAIEERGGNISAANEAAQKAAGKPARKAPARVEQTVDEVPFINLTGKDAGYESILKQHVDDVMGNGGIHALPEHWLENADPVTAEMAAETALQAIADGNIKGVRAAIGSIVRDGMAHDMAADIIDTFGGKWALDPELAESALIAMELNAETRKAVMKAWRKIAGEATNSAASALEDIGSMLAKGTSIEDAVDEMIAKLGSKEALIDALHRSGVAILRMDFKGMQPEHISDDVWATAVQQAHKAGREFLAKIRKEGATITKDGKLNVKDSAIVNNVAENILRKQIAENRFGGDGLAGLFPQPVRTTGAFDPSNAPAHEFKGKQVEGIDLGQAIMDASGSYQTLPPLEKLYAHITQTEYGQIISSARAKAKQDVTAEQFKDARSLQRAQDAYAQMLARADVAEVHQAQIEMTGSSPQVSRAIAGSYANLISESLGESSATPNVGKVFGARRVAYAKIKSFRNRAGSLHRLKGEAQIKERDAIEQGIAKAKNSISTKDNRTVIVDAGPSPHESKMVAAAQAMKAVKDGKITREEARAVLAKEGVDAAEAEMADGIASVLKRLEAYAAMKEKISAEAKQLAGSSLTNMDFREKFAKLRSIVKAQKIDIDALTKAVQSYDERMASKEFKAAQAEAKKANRQAKKAGGEQAPVPHAADQAVSVIDEILSVGNPVLLVKVGDNVLEVPQGKLHITKSGKKGAETITVRPANRSKTGFVITPKDGKFTLARSGGEAIAEFTSMSGVWEAIAADAKMAEAISKVKGLSVSPAKDGGTVIDHAVSQTAADAAATDGLVGRALGADDLARTPASFADELSAGWLVALRNTKTGEVRIPSKGQQDSPLGNVLGKADSADWTVGQVSAAPGKKGASRASTFRALGDGPAISESTVVPNEAAADAVKRRVPLDKLGEIELTPEAIARVEELTGFDVATAASLERVIAHMETVRDLSDPTAIGEHAAKLAELYAMRAAILPNGILRPTASKKESLASLKELFAGSPAPVLHEVSEMIRRLAGDRAPLAARGREGWEFAPETNVIGVQTGAIKEMPDHVAFSHELGHWAYFNLLTDAQRADFWKWYEEAVASGIITREYNATVAYSGLNETLGRNVMPAEVFADAFAQYVTSTHGLYRDAPASFWQSIMKAASDLMNLMLRFIGRDSGFEGRKGLDEYFDEVADKPLLDIFRAIMPEEVAPSRYLSAPEKNGKPLGDFVGKQEVDKLLNRAANLDEHRVKLDRMLRDGSAISVDEFASALKAASAQVYGALFSPDNKIHGLKSRLPNGASREKESTWLLSGAGKRGKVMSAVYELNKDVARALARAEEGELADVADGSGTNMSALAGLVDEKYFGALVDLLRDADYGSAQEKFADVKRLLEKAGVDSDEADAIAAELIDEGFSYSARVANDAAVADTTAEFGALVPLAQEVIGALLDAQTGLARMAAEKLPEGATIRTDRAAARRPITDATHKDKVVRFFKRVAKAGDEAAASDTRALRIAQLVQREEPAAIMVEISDAFAQIKRKKADAKWVDLPQDYRDLMSALSLRADLMDTIEPPAGKLLGDMPQEIAEIKVTDKTSNEVRNALQRGDLETAQWLLVRIQQERGSKIALPSLDDSVMEAKGYKTLKAAALKMEFGTEVGEALAREMADRQGSGIQFGLPDGVREDIAAIARDITHRNPMLEQIGHTVAYRALNMLDSAGLITEADVGRLTGDFGLASQQVGRDAPAYNNFRRAVRSIASATQAGDGNALAMSVAKMVSNMVERTDEEFISGVAAYLRDGKGIAHRLDAEGAEAFNRATEAAEYLLAGLPLKGDGFLPVKMRGNIIDNGGLRVLENLDDLASGSAKARMAAAISRLPREQQEAITTWAGASHGEASVFTADVAVSSGDYGRGVYLTVKPAADGTTALAARANASGDDAHLAQAALAGGGVKGRLFRPGRVLDMEKKADSFIVSELADRVAAIGGDVSKALPALDGSYGQAISALGASIPTGKAQQQRLLNEMLAELGFDGIRSGDAVMVFSPDSLRRIDDFAPARDSTDRVPLGGEVLEAHATTGTVNADPNAIGGRTLRMAFGPQEGSVLSKLLRKQEVSPEEAAAPYKSKAWLQLSTGAARLRKAGLNYLADFVAPEVGTALQARVNARVADFLYSSKGGVFNLLDKHSKMGGIKGWAKSIKDGIPSYSKAKGLHWVDPAQEPHEANVVLALRKGDLSGLTPAELELANGVNTFFRNMLDVQRAAGLNVGDATKDGFNKFYMPQLWSEDALKQNYTLAVEGFTKFFLRENSRLRGIDPDTGARLSPVAPVSMLENLTLDEARKRAERLVSKLTADADTGTILPSGVGGYKDIVGEQYFPRLLRLNGADLEATGLHAFMHNNLRGILAKYADTTARRIEWNAKFGDKLHGMDAYLNTVQGGAAGAIEVLTSAKTRRMVVDAYGSELLEVELEKIASLPQAVATHAVQQAALTIEAGRSSAGGVTGEAIAKAKAILMAAQPLKSADYERRVDAIVSAFADKGASGMAISRDEMKFVVGQMNALQRKPIDNGTFTNTARHFTKGMAAFNAITRLGFATLGSMPDVAMPLVRSGNFKAWATAWSNYMKDPDYRAAAKRMGTSMESILFESMSHFYGDGLGRVSQAFFNANLMTPWTKTMREVAAMVAIESIKTEQAVAQRLRAKGDFGARYQAAVRYLRHHGLAHLTEQGAARIDANPNFADDPAIRRAVQQFCDDTIFAPNQSDVPLWGQTPWGHLVMQFKTFPLMFGRFVKHHIVGEAKKQNYRPMMMALTALPAFGALSVATRDVVQGRADNDEDKYKEHAVANRSLAKLMEGFGVPAEIAGEAAQDNDFAGWYLDALIKAGGLGLMGDLAFNVLDQSDNGAYGTQRMVSLIGGPSAGAAISAWNVANGGLTAGRELVFGESSESGNDPEQRTAIRELAAIVPILGGVGTFKDAVTDAVVGPRLE